MSQSCHVKIVIMVLKLLKLLSFLPNVLFSFSIAKQHAVILNDKGTIRLKPEQGLVRRNGEEMGDEVTLKHQDR